jgi:hypothetical protein
MALFRCSRYRLVCGSILCLISMISLPMVLSSAAFATADSGYIYGLTTGPYGSGIPNKYPARALNQGHYGGRCRTH